MKKFTYWIKFITTVFSFSLLSSEFSAQPGAQYIFDLNSVTFPNYPNLDHYILNSPNIYVAGTSNVGNSINYYGIVSKIDTSGNLLWLKSYENPLSLSLEHTIMIM